MSERPVVIPDYRCLRGCDTFSKNEARVATGFLGRFFNVLDFLRG